MAKKTPKQRQAAFRRGQRVSAKDAAAYAQGVTRRRRFAALKRSALKRRRST